MTENLNKRMKTLVDYLNEMTKLYDQGQPQISDKEWDILYFELEGLENATGIVMPNSPTQHISYEVVNDLQKMQHTHKMLSLAKTKDWGQFLQYFGDKDVIGMVKLDGLTCSLEYQNGELIRAETRGNGLIGENILHNARVIASIPKNIPYKDTLVVDGEIICTNDNFQEFANEYANARNFASGSIRLLDSKECEKRKLTFVVWNVVEGFNDQNSFLQRLIQVEQLGFTTVPWTSSFDWDAKEFLIDEATKLGYPIDGLVGRFDDISYGTSLGETEHHSKAAFAFKFYDETYASNLVDIEWTMGRTGILTPVAVFDAIQFDGSTIERASLHNYSVMDSLMGKPYVGQEVQVFKANMIIPQIATAKKADPSDKKEWISFPAACPVCGQSVAIKESETGIKNMVCTNPNCEGKLINKLDHFCGKKGLDIKGLSKATLEKLINWGWLNNISDIFRLVRHDTEWMQKPGFGEKSVLKILDSIEAAKNTTLDAFISALGIPFIGKTVSKELTKYITSYEDFRLKAHTKFDFSCYEGFADSKTSAIWNYDFSEADRAYKYLTIAPIQNVEEEESNVPKSLAGITVVVTGKLTQYKNRAELQTAIEKAGGKVVGSVSKKTNYLINNDTTSNSSKNLTAKTLNIPIISENDFIKKFLT